MIPMIGSIPTIGLLIACTIIWFYKSTLTELAKHGIKKKMFLHQFWWLLLVVVLIASYSFYLLEYQIIIPLHRKQLLLYISPQSFQYNSIIWLCVLFISAQFLIHQYPVSVHKTLTFIFTEQFFIAMIFIGIWLILHDDFFMVSTGRWIQALSINSKWANFDAIIPLWIFLSAWSCISYILLIKFHKYHLNLIITFWLTWLLVLTVMQHYPRRLVTMIRWIRFDIKQYLIIILCWYQLYQHFIKYKSLNNPID